MKGFVVLLAFASAGIMLICGPPALANDTPIYCMNISAADIIDGAAAGQFNDSELLGIDTQAVVQEVRDPPVADGISSEVSDVNQLETLTLNRRPARNILRQGVRLLCFLTC